MRSRFLTVALVASLPLAASLAAEVYNPDALKERIIAHARTVTPDNYAFTRTIRTESTEENKKEERVVIDEVRFVSKKPTRVKLVVLIERFEAVNRYKMMPNGKPAPVESSSEMDGSMVGTQGIIRTRVTYSDVRAAGK